MPQAPDCLRAKWPGRDREATEYLENQGYILTQEWTWRLPTPFHKPTKREWSAIDYLVFEWDYAGLEKEPEPAHLRPLVGWLNNHVLRWVWMRVSWQEETDGTFIPGSWYFHCPIHPNKWYR